MGFKDYLARDLDVFFNLEEFAEMHEIDGREVPAIIDSDITKIRSNNRYERYDGIYKAEITVYVKAQDFVNRPVFGQSLRLDGKLYLVMECNEISGILEIVLGANES